MPAFLLGTGGLVRAYSDAVNSVINISQLELYQKLELKNLKCDYSELSKLEYIIKNSNINIVNKEFDTKVTLQLESTKEDFIVFEEKLPLDVTIE